MALSAAAVVVAILFVAQDAYRTFAETQERTIMAAALAAAEMAPRELDAPRMGALTLSAAVSDEAVMIVSAPDGEILSSTAEDIDPGDILGPDALASGYVTGQAAIAGEYGHVTIAVGHGAIAMELAQRAGIAFGGAFAMVLLAFGGGLTRRETGPDPLAEAVQAAPYGLAHWSADGTLLCANKAFYRLLRAAESEIRIGAPYSAVSRTISGKIASRPVVDGERQRMIEVEREDGSVIVLDERPSPSGGFVSVVSDVTDRKAADRMLSAAREEQRQLARRYHEEKVRAEAASRAKTCFLAHLSHDIRTPLNHIIGFADLMRLETYGPLGDGKYMTYLEDIKAAGEKLMDSFAEILEYAELEGGQKALSPEPLTVEEMIKTVAGRFGPRATQAGLRLRTGALTAAIVHADRLCVERMLDNLLDNAVRFTPRGGEVRLAAWAAEDGVVLEITDTGIGMGEDQLSRLSHPFALSDAAFTKSHDGIGLGIAIARAIAEASGGRLAIDSAVGHGTTVVISLPTSSAFAKPPLVMEAVTAEAA